MTRQSKPSPVQTVQSEAMKLAYQLTNGKPPGLIIPKHLIEKLEWFRDRQDTEVACMASCHDDNPLHIKDLHFIKQEVSVASVEFDDAAQRAYACDMALTGASADCFMRVWIHTHPGNSCQPSGTDWETFNDALGSCPWAVMAILGKSGEFSCTFRHGQHMTDLPVFVEAPDWSVEYEQAIHKRDYQTAKSNSGLLWTPNEYQLDTGIVLGKAKKRIESPAPLAFEDIIKHGVVRWIEKSDAEVVDEFIGSLVHGDYVPCVCDEPMYSPLCFWFDHQNCTYNAAKLAHKEIEAEWPFDTFFPKVEGKKMAFQLAEVYEDIIAQHLLKPEGEEQLVFALSDLWTLSLNTKQCGPLADAVDKAIRDLNNSINLNEESTQWLAMHEATAISDTLASSTPKRSSKRTSR